MAEPVAGGMVLNDLLVRWPLLRQVHDGLLAEGVRTSDSQAIANGAVPAGDADNFWRLMVSRVEPGRLHGLALAASDSFVGSGAGREAVLLCLAHPQWQSDSSFVYRTLMETTRPADVAWVEELLRARGLLGTLLYHTFLRKHPDFLAANAPSVFRDITELTPPPDGALDCVHLALKAMGTPPPSALTAVLDRLSERLDSGWFDSQGRGLYFYLPLLASSLPEFGRRVEWRTARLLRSSVPDERATGITHLGHMVYRKHHLRDPSSFEAVISSATAGGTEDALIRQGVAAVLANPARPTDDYSDAEGSQLTLAVALLSGIEPG